MFGALYLEHLILPRWAKLSILKNHYCDIETIPLAISIDREASL